jgi:outer membrane protein assembly factor BamA
MEPYAGLRFQYSLSNFKKYDDSISPENGYNAKVAGEWTDSAFGSDEVNEEFALRGDLRWYLEMPWADHHVWAVRAAVGWVWGDQQQFGAYRLGGPFGEGTGASYSSRVFPLRGLSGITFGGVQVAIYSTEYRIPLATNANFGIGTWPIFVDKIHMAFFCDGGDIRYRTDNEELLDRFLISVGAEVSGDFVLGYGLPITGRMGYGVVVMNRDRIAGLTDSITGMDLQNGSFYLQLGTMF